MEVNDTKPRQRNDKEDETEQEIWSWGYGAGTDGQLGTCALRDELVPPHVSLSSSAAAISRLSCGGAHAIALTSGAELGKRKLGSTRPRGDSELQSESEARDSFGVLLHHPCLCWLEPLCLRFSGTLFTCGDGSFGQLGHGNYESHSSPVEVSSSATNTSSRSRVVCDTRSSCRKRGQLGILEKKITSVNILQATRRLEGIEIVSIKANGDHSAALSGDGHLYTWGRGFPGNSDAHYPTCLPTSRFFSDAALGWNHALLLTSDWEAFMLGGNHHGILSDPDKISLAKYSLEVKFQIDTETHDPTS